jgi:hypothetical protein
MHHVRRDYFSYYRTPRIEHGIEVRDLLVFRRDVGPRDGTHHSGAGAA